MMTTIQLLTRLRELGVQLWAEDDRLRFTAPQGTLTAELRAALAERRQEVLGLLQQGQTARVAAPVRMPDEVAASGRVPLSFAQQRLWFLQQLDPASAAYNIARAMLLTGPLRADLLERSLAEVVRRHDVLRTTFAVAGGEPFQVVAPETSWHMPLVDLQALPAACGWAEMERLSSRLALETLDLADLSRGPLLRVVLLRLCSENGMERHVAAATLHHIAGDAWSTGLLFREMGILYDAFARGLPSPLPELPIQYADYAWWQRRHLAGEVLDEQLAFWKEALAGAPEVIELPTDRPRAAARGDRSERGDRYGSLLPRELIEPLQALGQAEGAATLFMVLFAGFSSLLYRWSGQEDLVAGLPIANRNRTEVEGLIGFFINTLVLRTRLSAGMSWREVLAQVRQTTLAAYAHQDLPFEKLVEELSPDRQLSQTPLFQVTVSLQNTPAADRRVGAFRMEMLPPVARTAQFDLVCDMNETPEGVQVSWRYREELFDRTTVMRLAGQYETLLANVLTDPDRPVSELPLLPAAERHQLLAEWSEVPAVFSERRPEQPIHALFEEQAAWRPDETAVVWDGGRLSYGELNRRANRLARHLRALGVGPEVPVTFCLERSPEMVMTILAILKAGGAYVPLDPAAPMERLGWLLADAGAPVVVTTERLLERLPRTFAITVLLDELDETGDDSDLETVTGGDGLAYLMYTSGSTGTPKGVAVAHRAILRLVRLVRSGDWADFGPEETWGQLAPVSFDASTLEIWGALLNGGRLALLPEPPEPVGLGAALARHGVTSLWLTAGLFHQMVEENLAGLAPLSQLLAGGDVLSPEHVRRALASHPGLRLINGYGPTENTTFTCCGPLSGADEVGWTVPLGRPIGRTRVHVLDAAFQPVPLGVAGELYAGGDGLARGYHGRPDLTADRFLPDPYGASGERLYRSGDRVRYLADGRLEFLGRGDRQVKVRGFRIEPQEIELVLARHPGLREAVVEPLPDPAGGKRLVAYVVPRNELPDPGELRAFLAETLPVYMLPAAFVILPELPLTANGKVDRRALPDPATVGMAREREIAAPTDPVEEIIAGIWREVLGAPAVGTGDDFFAIGGHSLLATQVISRMTEALGVMIPLPRFFEEPTVAEQAEAIRAARRFEMGKAELREPEAPPIVPLPREGEIPLSFAQQRLWFIDQLEPGSAVYNIPAAMRLAGRLDVPAIAGALQEVVRRHEVLRTSFGSNQGEPFQRIAPELRLPLPVIDLADLPEARWKEEAERLGETEAGRPFDLAAGPLVRWSLLRLGDEEHLALVTLHHIVSDGWSAGLFLRELAALYTAALRGEPSPLAELTLQYADFAAWQRLWLSGEVLERQVESWRRRLAGAPPRLELPADRPRPAVQSSRGATLPVAIPAPLADALAALGRRMGATPFMMLLAAFQILLSRLSGQDDVLVGSPIAGRNRREIEGLIGFFVNTLALRADLSGEPGFRQFVTRVREVALEAYDYQDLPFERLVEEIAPERSLAHTPLFQVMFALQNAPMGAFELPGLTLTALSAGGDLAKFDLTFTLGESAAGLTGSIVYAADLFDRPTVVRWMDYLQAMIADAVVHPDRPVSGLALLSEAERDQMLHEWNPRPAVSTVFLLHERFRELAAARPDAVALTFEDSALTYGELAARAGRLAGRLRALGVVGPDVRVGVCLERSLELVPALLAVLMAGGAYVPLDPAYPEERLSVLAEDAGLAVVVTTAAAAGRLPAGVSRLLLEQEGEEAPADLADIADIAPDPAHLAYVIYTSGSTGKPKGVQVSHAAAARLLTATDPWFGFGVDRMSGEVWSLFHSFAFDFSVWEIWGALLYGGRLTVVPYWTSRSPEDFLELLLRDGVTVLNQTPSSFRQLVRAAELRDLPASALALRWIVFGGEALDVRTLAPWFERYGDRRPRLVNMYGITETTVHVTWHPLAVEDTAADGTGLLGVPIPDLRLYLLDRSEEPVPFGVSGEIWVGGAGLARGYLGRPELTAERFRPDPWSGLPGERLYRSGDLAKRRADGELEFLGRIDHQVKIRGFRIEPGEVEAALRALPGVSEAVVLVREDGPGDRRLVAYLVASPGVGLEIRALRQRLQQTLPEHAVPSAIVPLAALPLTAHGKLDRRALPAPEEAGRGEVEYVAPETPTEKALAALWSELLGVERVGAADDFFVLGGHSMLAARLAGRLRESFHLELSVRLIFDRPRLADLAAAIDDEQMVQAGEEDLAALLAEMDLLSDEEAELELSGKGRPSAAGEGDGHGG